MKILKTALTLLLLIAAVLLCTACGTDAARPTAEPELLGPLTAFEARRQGVEAIDLSAAKTLLVAVNHCEYGEPTQYITDPSVIAAAAEAISNIQVTGGADGVSSTGTYYAYSFHDADGKSIASFAFQDGMLMEREGRCPVEGLSALYGVEGVMLDREWQDYWEQYSALRDEYAESFKPSYPETVFAAGGYATSLLADIDPAEISSVELYPSEGERSRSEDAAVIAGAYSALSAMRVTGKAPEDSSGETFTISLVVFTEPGFYDYTDFRFADGCLKSGDELYAVEGLDALLAAMP